MRTRILILILLAVIFQLITYSVVLIFGGEFRDLREYSYSFLLENAESSSTYIRNEFLEKPVIVKEHAEQLGNAVAGILTERGASVADLQTDKELDRDIIESSVSIVSSLLRCSMADDAYFILDTGDLYASDGGDNAKAALYLLDADSDDGDPLIALGFSSVSQDAGLAQYSNWSQYFTPDPQDAENYDFYYRTLQTAQENSGLAQEDLGYWSSFSQAVADITPSMKYSLPIIAEDGTVCGVLGVGLSENTVSSDIQSFDETVSHVLGYGDLSENYNILAHSGSSYSALLANSETLHISGREENGLCGFDSAAGSGLIGCVKDMELYGQNSPYSKEQWALIFVADRSETLHPLMFMQRMMIVSSLLSLIAAAIIAFPGSGIIIKPFSNLSKQIKAPRKYNEVIRFQPSNIYEIDEVTDAITQLQINVHGFSSQVSKMISIADVGLGTFMYDRTDDSVFVGQSLISVLKLGLPREEDVVMSRREFLDSIKNPDVRSPIAAGLDVPGGKSPEDFSRIYRIDQKDGSTLWLRLGYTYSYNSAVGIVQDITDTMLEKSRIEHERDYDSLTGLLNRHAYYRYLEEKFRDKSQLMITAIVMIDLDNLKHVNDTYGHYFGDSYIKTAAAVMKKFQDHGGIVARLSGDEFNVFLSGFSSKDEVRQIIDDVRSELLRSSCLLADGTHYRIGASMGVSWYPDDAESREMLMKYADFAMYTVKHSGKGGIAEFDINTYSTDSAKLADLEEMNRVIDGTGIQYAFQSIISVKTGKIYGYEALMRIQSEVFRSPLELLSTAKASARLHEIERLTWTRALADFQEQLEAGRIEKNALLFVNSIANHTLDEDVITMLESTYPHLINRIVMEILESESASEDIIARKGKTLQKWGGQIALDDYGTGYNSEYALLSLQPNIIKIDHSIVSGCDHDADRHMIIENLVKLAKAKGVLVLAEGVERAEEMETVISCGVDFLQGYYLARPLFSPEPISPELSETIRRLAESGGDPEDGD